MYQNISDLIWSAKALQIMSRSRSILKLILISMAPLIQKIKSKEVAWKKTFLFSDRTTLV